MAAAELLFRRLVVFGASGPSGRQVVEQALKKGHSVTAVVRSPDKFDVKHDALEVCKGDVFSSESLIPILKDKDAVISCLGFHGTFFRRPPLYSESMTAITTAMEANGVERIVCITGIYVKKDPGNPRLVDWFMRPLMPFANDMAKMETFLSESKFCYTIVKPPMLTNDPAKGNYELFEGQQTAPNASFSIPRADLADFILSALQSDEWNRKGMAISTKKGTK